MNQRTLKVEATGDFWRRQVKPRIRLCGQWLERAGFTPGAKVQVTLLDRGELRLQILGQPPAEPGASVVCASDNANRAMPLATWPEPALQEQPLPSLVPKPVKAA